MKLTNAQWNRIEPLVTSPIPKKMAAAIQQWDRQGVFRRIVHDLAEDLNKRGGIDICEAFIDGTFAPAKKGVLLSARQSAAKTPRSWQLQTLLVFRPFLFGLHQILMKPEKDVSRNITSRI